MRVDSRRKAPGPAVRLVRAVVLAGTVALLTTAGLAAAGQVWWVADLFGHFRYHYLLVAAVLLLLAPAARSPVYPALVLLACLPHLIAIDHPNQAPPRREHVPPGDRLRLVTFNLQWNNADPAGTIAFIRNSGAELVLVQEATENWHPRIEALTDVYPHIAPANWRDEPQNILLSKLPVSGSAVLPVPGSAHNFLGATVRVGGRRLRVFAVHPLYPLSRALTAEHRRYLAALGAAVRAAGLPVVVAGDFNLTPYTPRFRAFLRATGLRRATRSVVWPSTWPARNGWGIPVRFFPGIPIDHILVGESVALRSIARGPAVGSDHYPLVGDLVVKR